MHEEKKWLFPIFLGLILFIYIMTLKGLSGNLYPEEKLMNLPPFETSMERGRYAQIVSMVDYGTFNVDKFSNFLKPDLGWYDGHFYSAFPPGVAVLAAPFYIVGKLFNLGQVFAYFSSAFFMLLTAVLIYFIGRKLNLRSNSVFFAIILFSLGSVVWPYSVSLSAHAVSALLVTLSYLIAINIKHDNPRNLALFCGLWLVFILNLFIDYPNLVIILPCIIYSLWQVIVVQEDYEKAKFKLKLFPFWSFIIITPVILMFVGYNLSVYKKPIAFTNAYNLDRLKIQGVAFDYNHLSNELFKKKAYSSRFNIAGVFNGFKILLLSDERGLLFYSPVFILAFLGFLRGLLHRNWPIILGLSLFLFDVAVYGSFDNPSGGWAFGARYLIPTIPLMAIAAAYFFDSIENKNMLVKGTIALLTLFSIFTSLAGALTTNAVPTKIESVGLHAKYNFFFNLDLITSGHISSYLYKAFFHGLISPVYFFITLFLLADTIALWVIFSAKRSRGGRT